MAEQGVTGASVIRELGSQLLPTGASGGDPGSSVVLLESFGDAQLPGRREQRPESWGTKETLAIKIDAYFPCYEGPASSPLAEWEAFKVAIQGTSIATVVEAQWEVKGELKSLEGKLGTLEAAATESAEAMRSFQEAHTTDAELLERLRVIDYHAYMQHMYADADKSGMLLAHLIRPPPTPAPLLFINSLSDEVITTQSGINGAFKHYYANLNNAPDSPNPIDILNFLDQISLPRISAADKENMGAPISDNDIQRAINRT
ncbi:hypothetical protein NDU88_004387 [Pleurodeles waltl]|uniref:Uncharacterized protein n=1 Tax=Pleurodeles waltl TaxID=8319 RepID=A0AAV7M671_PLEWA|nr:hypothetical protein NDU88_004387 [Pleurodeles waltl]